MGKGGLCGLYSRDSFLTSALSTLIYLPTELNWVNPFMLLRFDPAAPELSLLPSHVRIPKQPPRVTL